MSTNQRKPTSELAHDAANPLHVFRDHLGIMAFCCGEDGQPLRIELPLRGCHWREKMRATYCPACVEAHDRWMRKLAADRAAGKPHPFRKRAANERRERLALPSAWRGNA